MCNDRIIHHTFRMKPNAVDLGMSEQLNANMDLWMDVRRIEREMKKQRREVRHDE